MKNPNRELTASNIRYLIALAELDAPGKGVRCTDAAKSLGVTKSSVHTMIAALEDRGFVERERYGAIHLTPEGARRAALYARCFSHIYAKLADALGLSPDSCRRAAHAVLAQMPEAELLGLGGEGI